MSRIRCRLRCFNNKNKNFLKSIIHQDPNRLVNDGTAMHWLVKSNFISVEETMSSSRKVTKTNKKAIYINYSGDFGNRLST